MTVLLLALLACGGEAPPAATAAAPPAPTVPDWNAAVALSAARTGSGAALTFDVTDGFHVYGSRETRSRPLRVEVAGHPDAQAAVPEGKAKAVAGSPDPSYVLTGSIGIDVAVQADGPLQGTLSYQVCTETLCSMPTTRDWSAGG